MNPPRVYRTEAIVLRHQRYGEAGRMLTLLSPHHGKIRVLARGVLRPTSHMAGHVEPLAQTAFLIARRNSGPDLVTQAQVMESHTPCRTELWRTSTALYAAELVDRLTEDAVESRPIYRLLQQFLDWLDTAGEPDVPTRYFEFKLLNIAGYRPELHQCLECGTTLEPVTNAISGPAGGCLCPSCAGGAASMRPVTLNALKVLRTLQDADLATARRLRLAPGLARELELLMRYYLPYALDHDLRSTGFVDAVRAARSLAGAATATGPA